ncbi:MAG: penicillin-binding protein activator [Pyrodictiaceae archaeon]
MGARLALAVILAVVFVAPLAGIAMPASGQKTIVVGALLPLTGDLQSYGVRAKAAIEVAVDDVNKYLEEKNAWFRIKLVTEDTGTKPDIAVQKFNALVAQGIKFIVGPMTSAEVKKIKDLATQHNILVISPSSTALELAIPGDNVFRFCPADDVQAQAIAKLVEDMGVKAVVLIIRADTWGEGLKDEISKRLKKMGVEIAGTIEYNPESPNFPAVATEANNFVTSLLGKYKPSEVAVILVAFNEAVGLFKQAAKYPNLAKVPWFGSDGTAKLAEIVKDPVSAQFAEKVLFINPIYSPAATAKQKEVAEKVKAKIGEEPDAYSYAAHDAIWAIALALLKIGPTSDMNTLVNKVKELLPQITTSDEFGKEAATGKFPLNKAGDRATADYDMWLVYTVGGKTDWLKVGTYLGNENKFRWYSVMDGKTFPEVYKETFGGAAIKTTTTPTTSSPSPTVATPASPASTSPSPTSPAAAGGQTALAVGIAIVVIVIIIAAVLALRRRR